MNIESALWSFVKKWMEISPDKVRDSLGDNHLHHMRQSIKEFARHDMALKRMQELSPLARRRPPENIKNIWSIVVVAAGSITYGAAMQILASSRGELTIPATFIGGALASYLVDALATKSFTNYYYSKSTKKVLKVLAYLWQQSHRQNELAQQFYRDQSSLVQEIEGTALMSELPINAIMGGGLSIIEYAIASWLFLNFAAADNTPNNIIRLTVAALPVLLTWAAANIQAQKFGLPEYADELGFQYQKHLVPPPDLEEDQLPDFIDDKYYQDARLDVGIQIILSNVPNPDFPTPEIAEYDFDVGYYQGKLRSVSETRDRHILERKRRFEQQRENLLSREPDSSFNRRGHGPAGIARGEAKFEQEHRQWVEQELGKLEDMLNQDLLRIRAMHEPDIEHWNTKIETAKSCLQQSIDAWNSRSTSG